MKAEPPPPAPHGSGSVMRAYDALRKYIMGRQVINVIGAVKGVSITTTPKGRLISIAEIVGVTGPGGGGTGPGACCVGTSCSILDLADCTSAGGTYLGQDTTCTPDPCSGGGWIIGACCHGSGCTVTSAAACAATGGSFHGAGSTCSPNPCLVPPGSGACCDSTGGCTDTTSAGCGGVSWHGGQSCASFSCPVLEPTGACCQTPTSACVVIAENLCSGLFHEGLPCDGINCESDFCGPLNYYCDPGNPHDCHLDRPPYWGPHARCCPDYLPNCGQCYDSISQICYACCCSVGWITCT